MFKGRISKDGKGFVFSDFFKVRLKIYMRQNPNQPFELKPILAESKKQRGWFEGGLCTLVAFYHEGLDHHDPKDVAKAREWLKIEFNSEIVALGGIAHKIAKSTKNELNSGFLEKIVQYLEEDGCPPEALDPKQYKNWHDSVFPYGGPDNYIDYLLAINIIKMYKERQGAEDGQPNYSAEEDEDGTS
jgi:hypothetical protein